MSESDIRITSGNNIARVYLAAVKLISIMPPETTDKIQAADFCRSSDISRPADDTP